jgi:phosphatidylserine/phosphatidylglycerophosphate/cardiolipin synthase-like enzyme
LHVFEKPYSRLSLTATLTSIITTINDNDLPHKVFLVCRPPHELIPINSLELLENGSNLTEQERLYLVDQVVGQKNTIDVLYSLLTADPEWRCLNIGYDASLHAKIVSSDDLAIMGSSNLTYSGMYINNEIAYLFSEAEDVKKIRAACYDIWSHSIQISLYAERMEEDYVDLKQRLATAAGVDLRIEDLAAKILSLHERR